MTPEYGSPEQSGGPAHFGAEDPPPDLFKETTGAGATTPAPIPTPPPSSFGTSSTFGGDVGSGSSVAGGSSRDHGKFKPWMIITAGIVIAALVAVLSILVWRNNINNQGYEKQRSTLTLYQGVQTELSTCLDTSLISSKVAVAERQSLKDLLIGTASARYVDPTGKSVDTGQAMSAGVVINNKSITEAYPDVSNALFKQLMTTAVGCRNQVAGAMENLQAYAGRFDIWTHQGSIIDKTVRNNWPNDELEVTGLGGKTITGKAALKFLTQPILTADATQAVQSHTMPNQNLFPSSGASPTQSLGKPGTKYDWGLAV